MCSATHMVLHLALSEVLIAAYETSSWLCCRLGEMSGGFRRLLFTVPTAMAVSHVLALIWTRMLLFYSHEVALISFVNACSILGVEFHLHALVGLRTGLNGDC